MTTPTPPLTGPTWVQSGLSVFQYEITNVTTPYTLVSQLGELEIPFPGVWEISYNVRVMTNRPSTTASVWVHTALAKNGQVIEGSEALTGATGKDLLLQTTIGQTLVDTFEKGDKVTLRAHRSGSNGTAHIVSQPDGRSKVLAHWVDHKA